MDLATLAKNQTLATLLQALAPTTGLVAGKTVEARLLALAGDGTATAQLGAETFSLILAGPVAKQAALQPGATLVLRLDAGADPAAPLQATLVAVRPPSVQGAPTAAAPQSQAQTSPGMPAGAPVPASVPVPSATLSGQAAAPAPAALPSATSAGAGTAPALSGAPLSPSGPFQAPSGAQTAPPRATAVASTAAAGTNPAPQAGPTLQTGPTASPRTLAGPLLGPALARQDSMAPLLANMRALADGSVSLTLPRPILTLVDRVLAQALPVERKAVTAPMLKTAIQNSGLFLEAHQAQGGTPPPGDLKAGLQALRDHLAPLLQALAAPAGKTAPSATGAALANLPLPTTDPNARPAPPRRDGALFPPPIAEASLSAGDKPLAIVGTLLEQTDAALDRITLSQYASLPPEGSRAEAQASQRWLTEIPLAFQNGATTLPLQIEKEPPRREAEGSAGPLWRVRFALDVEPLGPLQGVVTLQGRSVGITLWAEREDTSKLLRGASPGLEAALADAQFENRAIDIHTGQPRVSQPTAGQFLDRMS